jgi:hypothetical protein
MPNMKQRNRDTSEQQVSHAVRNGTDVNSIAGSNSEEFSHGVNLDKMSAETVFILRQALEAGNAMEEKIMDPNSLLECPVETFGISKSIHSTAGQK